MNAVDRFNKSIKSLGLRRPAKKWDRKLSVFLIESMIVNSYILFRKPHTKYNKTDYLEDLVLNYLSYDAEENHFCQEAEKQGRCVVCYKQGKRKVTYHQCGKCRNFLHPGKCYREYHTIHHASSVASKSKICTQSSQVIHNMELESILVNDHTTLCTFDSLSSSFIKDEVEKSQNKRDNASIDIEADSITRKPDEAE